MDFKIKLPILKVTDEQLLLDLKRVANLLKKDILSQNDYKKHGKYSISTYGDHFGNFRKALKKAEFNISRNWGTSREDYLENLKEVWTKLGRQPKYSEMVIPFSRHSSTSYAHTFGNWTKTLEEFKKYLEEEEIDTIESIKNKNTIDIKSHKTQRGVNWRLRFKVMQRDSFTCVACGRSPAKSKDIELHVDHIIPWSKCGETIYENLQTLCSVCNIGKSNI